MKYQARNLTCAAGRITCATKAPSHSNLSRRPLARPCQAQAKPVRKNFFGPDVGFGVRFFAAKKLSMRPEVRFAAPGGLRDYDGARDILEPGL